MGMILMPNLKLLSIYSNKKWKFTIIRDSLSSAIMLHICMNAIVSVKQVYDDNLSKSEPFILFVLVMSFIIESPPKWHLNSSRGP